MDFAILTRLGPLAWDQGFGLGTKVLHTMAHQLPTIIIVFIVVPQGPDFLGTLPLLGTYDVGPWDVV